MNWVHLNEEMYMLYTQVSIYTYEFLFRIHFYRVDLLVVIETTGFNGK